MTHPDDPTRHDGTSDASDGDPLAELLAAWQEQPIPEATPDLDDCDDETRAVVDWMAAAWAAQPVPAAAPPRPTQRLPRWPRRADWPQATRRAAAALLLAALTLTLLSGPRPSTERPGPDLTAATQATTTGAGAQSAAVTAPSALTDTHPEPQLVAVANDQIVFRSGPVRLVLITDNLSGE